MITPKNKEKGVIHGKETFSHCVHQPKAAEGDNLSAGKVMHLATVPLLNTLWAPES
jgi:hypothetical protein